jgi:peptidylprolyl isomerase
MKYFSILFILLASVIGCGDDPDVVRLDSGLQYADDSLGTGAQAKPGDLVTIHFSAWYITDSSNVFDDWTNDTAYVKNSLGSSKMHNRPVKFRLGSSQFIRGVDEGIEGMKTGGKRTIIVPSYLAYGEQGMGPVPPNANLKVVIELVDTKEIQEAKIWDADTTKTKTTSSGLKYIILEEGSGDQPEPGDVVSVNYSGYLMDGTKFDSSVDRDEPFVFTLGKGMVIKGWDEGIALLKEGGKAKLIIPPVLAYGERPNGPIPANSTLIFDVELVEIK